MAQIAPQSPDIHGILAGSMGHGRGVNHILAFQQFHAFRLFQQFPDLLNADVFPGFKMYRFRVAEKDRHSDSRCVDQHSGIFKYLLSFPQHLHFFP